MKNYKNGFIADAFGYSIWFRTLSGLVGYHVNNIAGNPESIMITKCKTGVMFRFSIVEEYAPAPKSK